MMNKTLFPLTTAALLMGSVAIADPFAEAVVKNLQDLGYDYIEVKRGQSQLKAEAVRGDRKLEVVYDLATGQIISREDEWADDDYVGRSGVEIRTENRDFLDDDDDDDDFDDDDDDDDRDDDDDDSGRGSDDDRDDDDDDSGRGSDDDDDDDDDSGRGSDDRDDDDDDSGSDDRDDDDDDSGSDDSDDDDDDDDDDD